MSTRTWALIAFVLLMLAGVYLADQERRKMNESAFRLGCVMASHDRDFCAKEAKAYAAQ